MPAPVDVTAADWRNCVARGGLADALRTDAHTAIRANRFSSLTHHPAPTQQNTAFPRSRSLGEGAHTPAHTPNKDLAELINSSDARNEDRIEVSANDIAQQKQAMKKAGKRSSQPQNRRRSLPVKRPAGTPEGRWLPLRPPNQPLHQRHRPTCSSTSRRERGLSVSSARIRSAGSWGCSSERLGQRLITTCVAVRAGCRYPRGG